MGQQGMPPLVIDPAAEKLQQLAASTAWPTQSARAAYETASRIRSKCPPPLRKLAGGDAVEYLKQVIPLAQSDILEQHMAYGDVRWLWYLRRAPTMLFEGRYGTTLGYDRLLAETLSSHFTARDTSEAFDRVAFRTDSTTFRYLARYAGRVKLLSQLHMLYRRVGKGAVLDLSHPLFTADTDQATENAIHIYDTRHDRSHEFECAGLGLTSVDPDFERIAEKSSTEEPMAFLSMACAPGFPSPVTYPDGAGGISVVTVQVKHAPKMLSLVRILNPIGEAGGIPDYLAEIAALIQLLMLVPVICVHVPWALSSIAQQGYVFVGEERLRAIVDDHLPEVVAQLAPRTPGFAWPTCFAEWRDAVLAVHASLWPLSSGNVLRQFQNNFLIDTSGASQALLHRLELARSPLVGNLRARVFELQCQDLIDRTSWAPPFALRALRGRPLRQNGKTLTDIDAIGVQGTTLLIVSCKSIIYDRNYDQGDFRVVRNTQYTVDQAVVAWNAVLTNLRCVPKGENFDFSGFDEILGVVCTPFAAYSSDERTLALIKPNLRACSSMLELNNWLAAD